MTDRKHTSETAPLAQKGENPLSHQERVYFEMFRAIELLGRKLEKSETIREDLSRRLKDIESSAARDAQTGKYYLPARIEPAEQPATPEAAMTRRMIAGAALTGLALGVIALGLVLMQQQPQTLSPRQMAALNTLTDTQNNPAFVGHASGGWHKAAENNKAATVSTENVTAEVAAETPASAAPAGTEAPLPFVLAASLEKLQDAPDTQVDEYIAGLDHEGAEDFAEDLPEDMAQGDTDMTEDISAAAAGLDHDDLAALVAQENAVDDHFAAADEEAITVAEAEAEVEIMPAAETLAPVVAKTHAAVPAITAYTKEPLRDPYLPTVYADLERRAYDGIAEAQHDLAALYASGGRVRPDYPRAAYWFRRAADAGIANAYYNLGVMAQQGLGMAKDAQQSFAFYGRAARLGHPEAMYNLGLCYIEGRGTQKDNLRGISYFKKAANAGLTQAAYNLGVIYEGGTIEGHRDLKSALEWYHVAAVEGHQDADVAIRRVEKLQMQAEALSVAERVEPAAGR